MDRIRIFAQTLKEQRGSLLPLGALFAPFRMLLSISRFGATSSSVVPSGPSVSVIVPVYNGGDEFRACLISLTRAVPQPFEIIVVADGDTDGSRDLARDFGVRVIEREQPGGPALARNLGAQAAQGEILFFVDADVTIPSDAISHVQAFFQAHPEYAALIGSYDDAPGASDFLSQYRNLLHHYVHQNGRDDAFTFWGACGAVRRSVFLEHGGFDQKYHKPCIEDIELGYRMSAVGQRIRLLKTLQVKHLKRWTATSLVRTDFFARALPWTELILRDGQMVNDLNLQRSSRLSVLSVALLLVSLVAALRWPKALFVAGMCAVALLGLNAPIYTFFLRKRGLLFALRVIPWHWFYYFYSGLAFGIGLMRFRLLCQGETHHESDTATLVAD